MSIRRSRRTEHLDVFMNCVQVGRLSREDNGALSFCYAQSWLEADQSVAISRQLLLTEKPITGKVVRNYFDNLLPDDKRIRDRIAARARASGTQAFDLLAAVGQDCVGALQFYPESVKPEPVGTAHGKPLLDSEIAEIIQNLRLNPLGINPEADFRISLAGAQNKTALLFKDKQWFLPSGSTPTTHILKPQIGLVTEGLDLSTSVENEWLSLRLLNAYKMIAAEAEIIDFEGLRVLVIKRFDREWDGKKLFRLPQEDLCQALGYGTESKYEADGGPGISDILHFLNESDQRDQDRKMFLKAQIIFWLMGATDGHAKNFSVSIRPGGGFVMSPFYDVMSFDPYISPAFPKQKLKLAMSVGDNRHYKLQEIRPKHWRQTAAKNKFADMYELIEEIIRQTPQAIEQVADELPDGFPAKTSDLIFAAITDRLKVLSGESNS